MTFQHVFYLWSLYYLIAMLSWSWSRSPYGLNLDAQSAHLLSFLLYGFTVYGLVLGEDFAYRTPILVAWPILSLLVFSGMEGMNWPIRVLRFSASKFGAMRGRHKARREKRAAN